MVCHEDSALIVGSGKITFEEFLAYDDGTDDLRELENGELVAIPFERDLNQRIASCLSAIFLQLEMTILVYEFTPVTHREAEAMLGIALQETRFFRKSK